MAEDSAPEENVDVEVETDDFSQSPPAKSSIVDKIKVLFAVGTVIAVECIAAFLYLPSAAETRVLAEGTIAKPSEEESTSDDGVLGDEDPADHIEVDLGAFTIAAFQPISNSTFRIDFHLYGTVHEQDAEEFHELLLKNQSRFKEQVNVTIRSADSEALTDASLSLVKRKILEKANRILGKRLLRGVIVSEFSLSEH